MLVSLAVIFLPILLPGKGDLAVSIDESNVPPAPDYRFPPLDAAPEPPVAAQAPTVPLEIPASNSKEPEPAVSAPQSTPAAKAPSVAPPEPVSAPTPLAVQPEPVSKRTPKPGEITGWIVQLGSFSTQANALALRDKLRGKGYTSFVEPVKSADKTVYRVRVGPELKREKADALLQKLIKDMSMKGLVQQYP